MWVTRLKDEDNVEEEVQSLYAHKCITKYIHHGVCWVEEKRKKNETREEIPKKRALIICFLTLEARKEFFAKCLALKTIRIFMQDDLTLKQFANMRECMLKITKVRDKVKLAFYKQGKMTILNKHNN